MSRERRSARCRVFDMAIYRAPRPAPQRHAPISDAARRAMELAALALTDAVPGLVGDEALAERERLWREAERQQSVQRQLEVGGKPWV